MANLVETTTPLTAGSTFTGSPVSVERGIAIVGSVFADRDGTLFIEQSGDGTNWDVSTSYPITASDGSGFEEQLVLTTFRLRFTNTSGSAQTSFRLYGNVKDDTGDFVGAIPTGPSPGSTFLVAFYDPGSQKWITDGLYNANDGTDANGLAAIDTGRNGKYVAFDVADGTVDQVTLQWIADSTAIAFDS